MSHHDAHLGIQGAWHSSRKTRVLGTAHSPLKMLHFKGMGVEQMEGLSLDLE